MAGEKHEETARIMGMDYGFKRIGIALSDPLLIFAYPYKTLLNDQNLWGEVDKIIVEKNVIKIILGYPVDNRGIKTDVTRKVEQFSKDLMKKFKLEVIFWDESYTSVLAQEKVLESVAKKAKRRDKGLLDQNSAAIILQEYLNTLN
ncbi:MAG TPA: Holliday junction resolvase RuvX [Ignavibacteriaceae bacterium]